MSEILTVAFEHEMREGALTYHKKTGTRPTRYLNMIESIGGVGAATELALDKHIQSGLQKAAEFDCIDLTSEYLIPHFPSIVDIQCGEKAILL